MKRVLLIIMVLCAGFLINCNKDDNGGKIPDKKDVFSLMDGSIIIDNHPNVTITSRNEFPESKSIRATKSSASRKSLDINKKEVSESGNALKGNNYRFKLVSEMSTLKIDEVEVQATDVKIADGFAFVSYNDKGDAHRGGVVVYKYTIHDGALKDVKVDVEAISSFRMRNAELSALDYFDGKLYMTGASSEPKFGYDEDVDEYNYAFFMVMELNSDKTFKQTDPKTIAKLSSFQGTSIRVMNNRVYITSGDGTNGTLGGLYVYDANNYTKIKSILGKDNARSVDVDAANIYLMQAEPARVTKYDLDGNGETVIYNTTNESTQHHAKSEMLVWNQYLFVAENESGLRMLFKENGEMNASLDRPGEDPETEVTNSVSMNSDPKKDADGKDVQSNLLFVANGESGICWYDVMSDGSKDYIIPCSEKSILGGTSANFITSKGNIVFVADGLGGLKVLYIGFCKGTTPPPEEEACDEFMPYTFNGEDTPEGISVFRPNAPTWIATLFSDIADVPNYLEIIGNTELYINFIFEGADWRNSLGYFVIPASVAKTDEAEYQYYKTVIEPDMCKSMGTDVVINEKYIIFDNITEDTKGGAMKRLSTYQIGDGKFNVGDRVVLFVVPNGWSAQNNRVEYYYEDHMFFMHRWFNSVTKVPFSPQFGDFKGQFNTFYSADCKTIVLFFEDNHNLSSDTDFNDVIFSLTDNRNGEHISSIILPKYTIGADDYGRAVIYETEN